MSAIQDPGGYQLLVCLSMHTGIGLGQSGSHAIEVSNFWQRYIKNMQENEKKLPRENNLKACSPRRRHKVAGQGRSGWLP